MFTSAHFIWLAVIAAAIIAVSIVLKKTNVPHSVVQKTVCVVLIILKLFHLSLSMKSSAHGGMIIDQTQLSFHLCSLMIYSVILINVIKNEKFVKTAKSFMVPCMLIGALMALLIPTEGVDVTVPRVWQYMLIHGVLVFYGFYLAIIERVDMSIKAYLTNLKLMAGVTVLAFLMNSVLEEYATNFLFLRQPPMEGLPILNLDNGWYVYFIGLTIVACLLLLLVHLPFFILNAKKGKEERKKDRNI